MHNTCIDSCMFLGKGDPSFTVRGGREGRIALIGQRVCSMRRGGHTLKIWTGVKMSGVLTVFLML